VVVSECCSEEVEDSCAEVSVVDASELDSSCCSAALEAEDLEVCSEVLVVSGVCEDCCSEKELEDSSCSEEEVED
jgi:hypothetical protein